MPNLTEMIAAIEAPLAAGTQVQMEAVGNSVRPAGWVPKFKGDSSPGFCNVCGPGYGSGKNNPGNVRARADARNIAALLNAVPGMLAAVKRIHARIGNLDIDTYSRGLHYAALTLLSPLYNALLISGAIEEQQ